jgi:hypothetical protein
MEERIGRCDMGPRCERVNASLLGCCDTLEVGRISLLNKCRQVESDQEGKVRTILARASKDIKQIARQPVVQSVGE